MIGILAKLAQAAKLAHGAEAAIDVASKRLVPGGGAADPSMPAPELDPAYLKLVEGGLPDARKLFSAKDAVRIIGKRIRNVALAATDDCLVCEYHCKDRAGTVIGVHLSKTLPWEGFEGELVKRETFADLGDDAFRSGRQLYVKQGEIVFWIHTGGEVMVAMAVEAARIVLANLEADARATRE
ncbi:MAG: hypothetical protein ACI8XO_004899 [Verrucomicrobiales bacterium]|jgi:hypothetical protein